MITILPAAFGSHQIACDKFDAMRLKNQAYYLIQPKRKMLEKAVAGTYISIYVELSNCYFYQVRIMDSIISIAKALSDPNRVRALMALREGELCVCQIIEVLGLVPSTVSKHMSILRQAGLVRGQKRGKWMYYTLASKEKNVQAILDWLSRSLCNDPVVINDKKTLKTIICRMGE